MQSGRGRELHERQGNASEACESLRKDQPSKIWRFVTCVKMDPKGLSLHSASISAPELHLQEWGELATLLAHEAELPAELL